MSNVQKFAIQAQPGFALLDPVWSDDAVVEIIYEPVIAWCIEFDGNTNIAIPITAESSIDDGNIVCRPDGTMFAPAEAEIPTEAAAKQWFEERARRAKDRVRHNP